MAKVNILTAEQELKLRRPIEDYVGKIQAKLDSLREDGTTKVVELQNDIDSVKRDHIYTKQEKETELTRLRAELEKARAVESKNKDEVSRLIADAENYLKAHYDKDYYQAVIASCKSTVSAWLNWKRSIRLPFPSSRISMRSKMRNTFTRTAFSMQRCSWKRTCSWLKTGSMRHLTINIT